MNAQLLYVVFSTTLVMSTLNLVLEKGEHTLHYITVRDCMSTILFFIQGQLISALPRRSMCHVYAIVSSFVGIFRP